MLDLATSSAKALSRKTTVVSPAGFNSWCHATRARARGSTSTCGTDWDRQTSSEPPPIEWMSWNCFELPSTFWVSSGTQRSRPSFSSSSNRMSCSVRSVLRCSMEASRVSAILSRSGSHSKMFVESSLNTRKPRSPARIVGFPL